MKELVSKKILLYNPETGKHEPIDAIRGESAYEIAVRTGQTSLPEDEWIKQVQSGQIDGDFVKTVNSLHPDENGNVKVTVNGQTADENGNIQIDVGGKVKSVNGQFPDPETGNVEIEVGNPDVITTLTKDEFNALTTAQIQKMYEDGVRTILVENEMEEEEGTYTISWDGITDKPNAFPPSQHTHGLSDKVDAAKLGGKPPEYYVQPRNLLDNSDFRNPINQRGQTTYTSSWAYSIDRWVTENAAATIENGGITVSSGYLVQRLLKTNMDVNMPYTLAVCDTSGNIYVGNDAGSVLGMEDSSFDFITIKLNAGKTYKWAALYEGEYTAENLPPYVPKGYAAELMECQRYYYQITATENANSIVASGLSNGILFYGFINLPTQMAGNPEVKLLYENIDIYPMEIGGKIDITDCYLDNMVKTRNMVCFKGTMVGENVLPAKASGALRINANGYIAISTDL